MLPDGATKNACDFALRRVGYLYSQELRHSGTHFGCSSLVYYAWLDAGVDISYGGATIARYGLDMYEVNIAEYNEDVNMEIGQRIQAKRIGGLSGQL